MKRCQVAQWMTGPLTRVAPACGRKATHYSEGIPATPSLYMCTEHASEIRREVDDDVAFEELES